MRQLRSLRGDEDFEVFACFVIWIRESSSLKLKALGSGTGFDILPAKL